ncbi:MAG TPA: SDR family NAD(P)-dependent oxidoreductase [Thermoanaerobaculia bacterium]|nr:SDR family NAD(P)-dependent oxidoreductase [Thermoanaerobaculia bacterium]
MKTIVVTGGSGELGAVVLPRLTREFRCIAAYRSDASRRKLEENDVVAIPDLAAAAEFAPLYALVHLAGSFQAGNSVERFERMIEDNLLAAARAAEAVLPHLEDGGRIIAISSAASLTRPAGLAAYSASKAALNSYVETLAKDLKSRAITVNALLPTMLDTDVNRKENPSERLVKRTNVAEMIVLLLSEQAATVSGQLIGMSA